MSVLEMKEGNIAKLTITVDGEEIYYISNPALGLWADRKKF